MIAALAAQLLVGMANNLWLEQSKPNLDHASPAWLLSLHTAVALVLVLLALWILVEAIRLRQADFLVPAAAGLAGIVLAYAAGSAYYVAETSVWSYLMTVGFVVAFTSYALAGRHRSQG